MRKILITLGLLALFLEISGLVLSGSTEKPSAAMTSLLEPPARVIKNPKQNGFILTLGFASDPSRDPMKVGFDIWSETEIRSTEKFYNYAPATRSALFLNPKAIDTLTPWNGTNPLLMLQEHDIVLRRHIPHHATLLARYVQWLDMPFEDWGYGRRGNPRWVELFAAHRLYLGEGFGKGKNTGITRLQKDLAKWRAVMVEARTLSTTVMAVAIISEDAALASDILSQPTITANTLSKLHPIVAPLTPKERSLQWPIQNEFFVGIDRPVQEDSQKPDDNPQHSHHSHEWLASMAGLRHEALDRVELSLRSTIFGISFTQQRTLNMYAEYYEALIQAMATYPSPLPKLRTIGRSYSRTLTDTITHPVHHEPGWDQFLNAMLAVDTRLRLASLQATLRKPSHVKQVGLRIAETGSDYYDPFTELPIMWDPIQERLYSVGKDGMDDGGDPTFDIAVPAVITTAIDVGTKKAKKFRKGGPRRRS